MLRCPSCQSIDVRHSRRRNFIRVDLTVVGSPAALEMLQLQTSPTMPCVDEPGIGNSIAQCPVAMPTAIGKCSVFIRLRLRAPEWAAAKDPLVRPPNCGLFPRYLLFTYLGLGTTSIDVTGSTSQAVALRLRGRPGAYSPLRPCIPRRTTSDRELSPSVPGYDRAKLALTNQLPGEAMIVLQRGVTPQSRGAGLRSLGFRTSSIQVSLSATRWALQLTDLTGPGLTLLR